MKKDNYKEKMAKLTDETIDQILAGMKTRLIESKHKQEIAIHISYLSVNERRITCGTKEEIHETLEYFTILAGSTQFVKTTIDYVLDNFPEELLIPKINEYMMEKMTDLGFEADFNRLMKELDNIQEKKPTKNNVKNNVVNLSDKIH